MSTVQSRTEELVIRPRLDDDQDGLGGDDTKDIEEMTRHDDGSVGYTGNRDQSGFTLSLEKGGPKDRESTPVVHPGLRQVEMSNQRLFLTLRT